MSFGKKTHPIWSLLASSVLVAVGLVLLAVLPASAASACIVLYGMGGGIRSIVRGTGRGDVRPRGLRHSHRAPRPADATVHGRRAYVWCVATGLGGQGGALAFLCAAALLHVALVVPLCR
ncbi:hypothetical protein [Dankookia sp. P2]|uniref:hypothetical protein n=1 Tax=Dankookia sp. P2 TaxID=3423955 RepID=UPI003D66DC0D